MADDPFKALAGILSPRYREEGPPAYIESFLNEDFLDKNGRLREPMKTALDLVVLGYRPVTTLCILATFVENKNKPSGGRQLGIQLEKRLGLEEGKLTTGRYYDDRIGRLVKILCQLGILESERGPEVPRAKEGYRICESLYPVLQRRMTSFLNGESLSPLAQSMIQGEAKADMVTKQCSKCKSMITSREATYCELCGAPLEVSCFNCGKKILCKWESCNHCGAPMPYNAGARLARKIDLESLLPGGFPQNYAIMLSSSPYEERDLIVESFLEGGLRKGQVTFHVTMKESRVEALAQDQHNFYLFICNPQTDEIVKSRSNVFRLKGIDNLNDIYIALESTLGKLDTLPINQKRICIEVISDILLRHHAAITRKWLGSLIPRLKSKGFTILAAVDPKMHPAEEVSAVLDIFDCQTSIYEKETSKGPQRFLRIDRMPNQRVPGKEILLGT